MALIVLMCCMVCVVVNVSLTGVYGVCGCVNGCFSGVYGVCGVLWLC